jgi:wyosine [tRNA(Phe)-imidazoG37] synthetase (radical SAM superfamily)
MAEQKIKLHIENHDRDIFDSKYIYPVVSRRAGGLSLGVNLNTNNACNWQCIYCEIPNLTRGKPEPINLLILKKELNVWLDRIINSNFISEHTPLNTIFADIAISGNGEPTAVPELHDVLKIIYNSLNKYKLTKSIPVRLISNGSFVDKQLKALNLLKKNNGEIWFKIDSGSTDDIKKINQINPSIKQIKKNIQIALENSNTVIQTCFLKIDQEIPTPSFLDSYISLVKLFEEQINSIHIYSLARPSHQSPLNKIDRLTLSELDFIKEYLEKKLTLKILIFS